MRMRTKQIISSCEENMKKTLLIIAGIVCFGLWILGSSIPEERIVKVKTPEYHDVGSVTDIRR